MTFEEIRQFRNERNQFAKWLGIVITKVDDGYAEAKVPVVEQMRNPAGSVQCGVSYTFADATAGAAAASHGGHVATSDASFYYLRPALNTKYLTAVAIEVKRGKRQMIYDVIIRDDQGRATAKGVFNYMSIPVKVE